MHPSPSAPAAASTPFSTTLAYTLFLLFGLGSWLTVNGLFAELPLLVAELPEGWRLASVLALTVQFANIGPLLYCFWRRHSRAEERLATRATYIVLLLGCAAMFCLVFCWRISVHGHSLPLLALAFVASIADCSTSLLFWRFAGGFRPLYLSALAAGEGLSGAVASFLTWLQGAALPQPHFSAGGFFALLATLMAVSCGAFHTLRVARSVRGELRCCPGQSQGSLELGAPLAVPVVASAAVECSLPRTHNVVWLLLLQAWLNVLQNGISVSCLALAAKPYGRGIYQLAQGLSLCVDPPAAALGFRLRAGVGVLGVIALVLGVIHAYVVALALVAVPKLEGGGAVLVAASVIGRVLTAYAKMRANVLLQAAAGHGAADELMVWAGAAMQGGACVGSVGIYVLINCTDWFRSAQ